jgi:hypothetical protein
MGTKDLLEEALKLKPKHRFMLVEGLIKSLDEPTGGWMRSGPKKRKSG